MTSCWSKQVTKTIQKQGKETDAAFLIVQISESVDEGSYIIPDTREILPNKRDTDLLEFIMKTGKN